MCRLFCWSAVEQVSPEDVLGTDSKLLADLSTLHKDGWGAAVCSGKEIAAVRGIETAIDSPDFQDFIKDKQAQHGLIHLRWATGQYAVCMENTHPFLVNNIAFIHNGGFENAEALVPLIAEDLIEKRQGTVDSELYFLYLLTLLRTMTLVDAYSKLIPKMEADHAYTSLNAMILTNEKLHVISAYSRDRRPAGVESDYYELSYQELADNFSAWSSGVRDNPGKVLPNNHVLTLDLKSRSIEISRIEVEG
jgi:predicted glutamine amidotransferase